ncbi:MAG: sigma-70 family RNA polymerase sigma factor [Planctomycetota bacterium]
MADAALPQLVEDLFRHRYGRMVAGLVRVLGADRIELAEDVVQEAFVRALRTWPSEGVPEKPDAWVFAVARNKALDALRRRSIATRKQKELLQWANQEVEPETPREGLADDTLRMMFTCCHPAVPQETRVPLVLKTVCGFGVSEIAAALLQKEGTVAQRLTRGKARLQAEGVGFEVPRDDELPQRLPLVLEVLYLLFNEGHRAHRGQDLVRRELVEDAVRLCALLLEHEALAQKETHALLALMLLLGSRLPARTDDAGDLLTLAEQDRSKWDRQWLGCGFHHFRLSLGGERMTAYHVEAAIASIHAAAKDYASTDWVRVLAEYDRLLAIAESPVVRLNRAIAVAKVHGPEGGLAEIAWLQREVALADYFLLPAVAAHFCWLLGRCDEAERQLVRAIALPCSEPERRLLQRRLDACRRGDGPPAW